jgi:uncharacterized protein YgiM (DUF1202 family)
MESKKMLVASLIVLTSVSAFGETALNFPFEGTVTRNNVYVRSGPGINYYPVTKLMRDNKVQVVGVEDEWFKIASPEGTFSLVSKDYVEKKGDKTGVITGDRVSIRSGSTLNDKKTNLQLVAGKGMEVTIIGEDGEWYKIVPPEGAFLYISSKFVKSISDNAAVKEPAVVEAKPEAENEATTKPASSDNEIKEAETSPSGKSLKNVTTTIAETPSLPGKPKITESPFTKTTIKTIKHRPAMPEGSTLGNFTKKLFGLNKKYEAEMKKPLPERNFAPIMAELTPVSEQTENKTAAKFAKSMLEYIDYQSEALRGLTELTKIQKDFEDVMRSTPTAPGKLEEDTNPDTYRLQGTGVLRPSLVFEGALMPKRYRLYDMDKGRTIAYVQLADDVKITVSQYLGKNVAVYGTSVFDAKLGYKVISADAFRILEDQPAIVNSPAVIP